MRHSSQSGICIVVCQSGVLNILLSPLVDWKHAAASFICFQEGVRWCLSLQIGYQFVWWRESGFNNSSHCESCRDVRIWSNFPRGDWESFIVQNFWGNYFKKYIHDRKLKLDDALSTFQLDTNVIWAPTSICSSTRSSYWMESASKTSDVQS